MSVKTKPWDAAEHIQSVADAEAYIEAAIEDGDPAVIAATHSDVARASAKEGPMNLPSEKDIGHMLGKPRERAPTITRLSPQLRWLTRTGRNGPERVLQQAWEVLDADTLAPTGELQWQDVAVEHEPPHSS